MRAQHRYQIMLAMAAAHRRPLAEAVTEPGDYDVPERPAPGDSEGDEESPPVDWDTGMVTCTAADCDELPEIEADALCAIEPVEPSEAELAFCFAPVEILLDGVAI